MRTDSKAEPGATMRVRDAMALTVAVADQERETIAREVEALTLSEILLVAGEMTAGERRTVKALQAYIARRIRNPKNRI